jgi:asparagine synthase (glutamine-hydrolysing)
MPGITGIIRNTPYDGIEADLQLMLATMQHEPHYRGSQYVDRDLGLYVGWISTGDAADDAMPLVCRGGEVVIIFQGENYADPEQQTAAYHETSKLRRCHARRLQALYEKMGDKFLTALNGWFCGVIADRRTRTITLFNDRYGMGRTYFHQADDEFLFASEAKCLLKVRPTLRRISVDGLAQHLRFNCVLDNQTLFQGISSLPGASSWVFNTGSAQPRTRRYFAADEWEKQTPLKPNEFYEAFSETISRIVPEYVEDSGRVGLSLTAGLDTRLILAALNDAQISSSSCYTFGGSWGDTYDIRTGRKLASLLGRPFSVIRTDENFLAGFPRYAQRSVYISDGTHDAFNAHDVYFSERAREISTIRVNGKFGSEVVRVRKLIPSCSYQRGFIEPELQQRMEELPTDPASAFKHPLSRVVFAEVPWHEYGRVAVEQSQTIMRTPYMDNRLVRLMFRAPEGTRAAGELQARYITAHSPELSAIVTNMGKLGKRSALLAKLLEGPYRALFKVEYIYLYATPHWLTRIDRRLPQLRLERRLAGRQKFESYRIWIKTEFADFIRDSLLRPQASYTAFFNKRSVEMMLTRHIAGTHNYLAEINRALTIELVHSLLLNQ